VFQEGTWVVIQQDDAKKPLPRYEQGAALMGPNLYIMGGHYSEQTRGPGAWGEAHAGWGQQLGYEHMDHRQLRQQRQPCHDTQQQAEARPAMSTPSNETLQMSRLLTTPPLCCCCDCLSSVTIALTGASP
jgi:hypothetical protein